MGRRLLVLPREVSLTCQNGKVSDMDEKRFAGRSQRSTELTPKSEAIVKESNELARYKKGQRPHNSMKG